jgi:hypothetical protein
VTDPKGYDPGGKIDMLGVREVFELRRRWGPQGKQAADVSRFIGESYFERAIRP